MKRKLVGLMLSAAMLATMLTGCGNTKEPASTQAETSKAESSQATAESSTAGADAAEDGYKGTLDVMHFSTSEESQGNGGSDGFRTVIAKWQEANPDITLDQQILANDDYKTQVATLAAAGDLPDVFLLQGMNTISWAKQNQVLDLTEYIKASPYYADYNQAYFTPFTSDGKIYGLPALTGGTCTVVVYDKSVWGETFPATWEEIEAKAEELTKDGITPIAFGNNGKWQANSCFLSTLGDRYTGADWLVSMINKGGAAFTDETFVAALAEMQRLFSGTKVFNKDFNAISNEDAREYYIDGSAAAFVGGNWDVSYLQATLAGTDKFDNTGFAVLPQSADAGNQRDSQNIGLGYAVAINPEVAKDPAKLAAALDFAYYVTGPEFSGYVAETYALGGLTKAGDVDWSKFDKWTMDFYNFSYVDSEACEIYDSYISSAVWDVLNTDLQTLLNGGITPEDMAANAQKAYEANY